MEYRARTLTGRIALRTGLSKAAVRDIFLVTTIAIGCAIALIAALS